jgi:hypothetical protein
MLVDINYASDVFKRLPPSCRFPGIHPAYVYADTKYGTPRTASFFVYEEEDKIFYFPFHIAEIGYLRYKDICTPYGYGGPCSNCKDPEFINRAKKQYLEWAKSERVVVEFVRFHPLCQNWNGYWGNVDFDRPTVFVDLTNDDLLDSYSGRSRTAIRKAIKSGVQVDWCGKDTFLYYFPPIYYESMRNLSANSDYFFSNEYFSSLIENSQVSYCLATYENKLVGGAIFLLDEYCSEYHLSCATDVGKKVGAPSLMLHESFSRAKRYGAVKMHLGGGTDRSLDNRLLFYKQSLGSGSGEFKIGYYVHQPSVYENLKDVWISKHNTNPKRVIFYR